MRPETRFRLASQDEGKLSPTDHRLVVVGVGGCGGNTVRYMQERGMPNVSLIAANTDVHALRQIGGDVIQLALRSDSSRGHGAGSDPAVGEQAARASKERIVGLLKGADMVFIAAGMGGGTGTGAAPVVAEIARDLNILTVAVVTRPRDDEGAMVNERADRGIDRLRGLANSLIVVPNQRLMNIHSEKPMVDIYRAGTAVLCNAVQGIAEMILTSSLVNIDFGDIVKLLSDQRGFALMGVGVAEGKGRDDKAVNEAIRDPLLEDADLSGARGLLVNITGVDPSFEELRRVNEMAGKIAAQGAVIKCGVTEDAGMGDALKVTVIATGIVPRSRDSTPSTTPGLVPFQKHQEQHAGAAAAPRRIVRTPLTAGMPSSDQDYSVYEEPAFMCQQSS